MNEPARNLDPRSAAQEELESILREAEAAHRSKPEAAPAGPIDPASTSTTEERRTAGAMAAARLAEASRFRPAEVDSGAGRTMLDAIPARSVAIVLGIAALILWIAAPKGLRLAPPQGVTQEFRDASARYLLALTMQRIDRYESEHGQPPESLDALDPGLASVMSYERFPNGGCVLRIRTQTGVISLPMNTPRDAFLGRSAQLLHKRPGALL